MTTQFKSLREAVEKEHSKAYLENIKGLGDATTQEQLNKITQYARATPFKGTIEQQKRKILKMFAHACQQRIKHDFALIESAENANDAANPLIITVEWKRSNMWGMNPTASTNYGFEGSSIGGCGYDKHSTATAQALNSCPFIMKALYAKKDELLRQHNRKPFKHVKGADVYHKEGETYDIKNDLNRAFIGYGSGYGIIPRFDGGVGVECHRRICEALGFQWESITDTKHVNVYRVSKVAQ